MLKIKPLCDNVVIEPQKKETETKSGIFIPESEEKPGQGKVVAVGPGKYENGSHAKMQVNIGDIVMFSKYAVNEIKIADKEYIIIREDDIMVIL